MRTFDHIALIYNPQSTGNAPDLAKEIARSIDAHAAEIRCKPTLTPTKHAGHARELAEKIVTTYAHPLIISVSGDGGYNEIVNGVMDGKQIKKSARPVVAVAAAGNANDHRRVMRDDTPLIELIKKHSVKSLDLLLLTATSKDFSLSRYAHSYIGLGITPEVGVELNKHSLNLFQEIRIVLKAFLRYKPFTIEYQGTKREVDSLIFANINEMAKVIKLHQHRNVSDDQFEVVEFPHRGKVQLLWMMLIAAARGLRDQPQYSTYTFKTFDSHPVQLDGEIEKLPRRSTVRVSSAAEAIDSLYV